MHTPKTSPTNKEIKNIPENKGFALINLKTWQLKIYIQNCAVDKLQ